MPQIIGFGALNVDNIFKVENLSLSENPAYPADIQAGGNAANTIAALAKLGVSCGFVGVVANDAFGKLILSEFRRRKVDTSQIVIRKQPNLQATSGIVETYVDKKGRRSLFVKPGVNSSLAFKEINIDYLANAKFVHVTSYVDDKQFEIQKQVLKKLHNSVKVSFAPGSLYVSRSLREMESIISRTYVLFIEKKEAFYLTKKNYKEAATSVLKMGPKIVVITLGKDGCYVASDQSSFIKKPPKVNVIDTTGAGDAFAAGFLLGLVENYNLEKCSQLGNAVASFTIRRIGARAGLPNRKELSTIVSLTK